MFAKHWPWMSVFCAIALGRASVAWGQEAKALNSSIEESPAPGQVVTILDQTTLYSPLSSLALPATYPITSLECLYDSNANGVVDRTGVVPPVPTWVVPVGPWPFFELPGQFLVYRGDRYASPYGIPTDLALYATLPPTYGAFSQDQFVVLFMKSNWATGQPVPVQMFAGDHAEGYGRIMETTSFTTPRITTHSMNGQLWITGSVTAHLTHADKHMSTIEVTFDCPIEKDN